MNSSYQVILHDLNREIARVQPEDVLQFCANWFNAKLEEQRVAGRLSIAQSKLAGVNSHNAPSPISAGFPANVPSSALKKKASLPSLAGSGYTFGNSNNVPVNNNERSVSFSLSDSGIHSPYSEVPPGMRMPTTIPPVPSTRSTSGGINWNKSFGASSGGPLDNDSDEENSMHAESGNAPYIRGHSESRDKLAALPSGGNGGSPMRSHFGNDSSSSSAASSSSSGIPQGINLGRRTSVSAESINPNSLSTSSHPLPKTVIPKTASQRARIESSIEKNLLFRNLDEDQHNDVLNAMKEVRVSKGTEVIVQGAVGDFFYVVESGEFQIWVKPANSGMVTGGGGASRSRSTSAASDEDSTTTDRTSDGSKMVASISAGGSFGELALMYNAPRAATVVCSSSSATLWALDRVTFRTILMEHTSKKRRMYEKFLSEVPILVSLEAHERSKIADALEERVYEEGEDVVREGELGKNFYIIESGRAEVLKRKGNGGRDALQERVGTLSKGDYFGELALLNSAPRAATVRPLPGSGRLRVATLGEKAFTRLLGPVVEILTRRAERNYGASSSSSTSAPSSSSTSHSNNNNNDNNAGMQSNPTTPTGGSYGVTAGAGTGPRGENREGAGGGGGVGGLRSALKSSIGASSMGSASRNTRDRDDAMMQD